MLIATCNVQSAFNSFEEFKKSFETQNVWTQEHSDSIANKTDLFSVNGVLIVLTPSTMLNTIFNAFKPQYTPISNAHIKNLFIKTKFGLYVEFLCQKSEEDFLSLKDYLSQENYDEFLKDIKEIKKAISVLIEEEKEKSSYIQKVAEKEFKELPERYKIEKSDNEAISVLIEEEKNQNSDIQRTVEKEFEELQERYEIEKSYNQKLEKKRKQYKLESYLQLRIANQAKTINDQQNEITELKESLRIQEKEFIEIQGDLDVARVFHQELQAQIDVREKHSKEQSEQILGLQNTLNNLTSDFNVNFASSITALILEKLQSENGNLQITSNAQSSHRVVQSTLNPENTNSSDRVLQIESAVATHDEAISLASSRASFESVD
jgi:hypothetical protein